MGVMAMLLFCYCLKEHVEDLPQVASSCCSVGLSQQSLGVGLNNNRVSYDYCASTFIRRTGSLLQSLSEKVSQTQF